MPVQRDAPQAELIGVVDQPVPAVPVGNLLRRGAQPAGFRRSWTEEIADRAHEVGNDVARADEPLGHLLGLGRGALLHLAHRLEAQSAIRHLLLLHQREGRREIELLLADRRAFRIGDVPADHVVGMLHEEPADEIGLIAQARRPPMIGVEQRAGVLDAAHRQHVAIRRDLVVRCIVAIAAEDEGGQPAAVRVENHADQVGVDIDVQILARFEQRGTSP